MRIPLWIVMVALSMLAAVVLSGWGVFVYPSQAETYAPQTPGITIGRRVEVQEDGTILFPRVVLDAAGYLFLFRSKQRTLQNIVGYSRLLPAGEAKNLRVPLGELKTKKYAWAVLYRDDGDGYLDHGDLATPLRSKNAQKRLRVYNAVNGRPIPPPFLPAPPLDADTLKLEALQKQYPPPGEYPIVEGNTRSFFDDDERAQAILAGKAVFDMRSSATGTGDAFGAKILSGLRMLGYIKLPSQRCQDSGAIFPTLCQFQRRHGLPESPIVDARTLAVLDGEVRNIKKRDRDVAKTFPCSEYMMPAPKNAPPKEHLAFLYATALGAFPEPYRIRTKKQCFDPQVFTVVGGKKPWDPSRICAPDYWPDYNDQCERAQRPPSQQPQDDYDIVAKIIHEYSHSLDVYRYSLSDIVPFPPGKIDAREFSSISYDTSDVFEEGTWLFFKPRVTIPDGAPPEDPRWAAVQQHFFSYGSGWTHVKHPGYYTATEDFATSMAMYILHGAVFREYMQDKPPLQEKYQWIQAHVFAGKEFRTGDPAYAGYAPNLYFIAGAAADVTGFVHTRPDDYVWGNSIPEPVVFP